MPPNAMTSSRVAPHEVRPPASPRAHCGVASLEETAGAAVSSGGELHGPVDIGLEPWPWDAGAPEEGRAWAACRYSPAATALHRVTPARDRARSSPAVVEVSARPAPPTHRARAFALAPRPDLTLSYGFAAADVVRGGQGGAAGVGAPALHRTHATTRVAP